MALLATSLPIPTPRSAWRAVRIEAERTPRALRAWFAVLAAFMAIGAVAAVRALIPGDKGVATTPTFEWGLLIVGYVFFAVTTSGLCLASSLGTVFGIDRFRPLEKRHAVLALLCLVTAFGIIALDLHYPVRLVFGALFSPSPSSPMWWMGVFYATYLVFLVTEVWSIFWRHARIHAWACVAASGMAIIAPSTLGAVFGVLAARPIWNGVFSPLLMLATGLLSGTALLGVVFYPVTRLNLTGFERAGRLGLPAIRSVLAVALAIVALLVARQIIAGSVSSDPGLTSATRALTSGPLAVGFVGVRLLGGLALPALLLLLPWTRRGSGVFLAGALILVGVFADRLTFVEAGQIAPTTATSGVVSAPYAHYSPSLVEIGIVAGAIAFVAFVYTLAERYLDLRESDVHIGLWMWVPFLRPAGAHKEAVEYIAVAEPEAAPEATPWSEPSPGPEPETDVEAEPVFEAEAATEAEPGFEAEPATEAETECAPEPEFEPEIEPEPEAASESELEPESEPAFVPEFEPDTEPDVMAPAPDLEPTPEFADAAAAPDQETAGEAEPADGSAEDGTGEEPA